MISFCFMIIVCFNNVRAIVFSDSRGRGKFSWKRIKSVKCWKVQYLWFALIFIAQKNFCLGDSGGVSVNKKMLISQKPFIWGISLSLMTYIKSCIAFDLVCLYLTLSDLKRSNQGHDRSKTLKMAHNFCLKLSKSKISAFVWVLGPLGQN